MSRRVGRKAKRGRKKKTGDEEDMGRALHKETIELINYIKEYILKDGEQKSIRRIYYALESRQIIESSTVNYQKIKNVMKQARLNGLIHPNALLLDKGRKIFGSTGNYSYHAEDVINALGYVANWYSINKWDVNDCYIELWQEKESMEKDFSRLCGNYGVICVTGRGDQSITAIYHAMKRWKQFLSVDKKIIILYAGDFNPSGMYAPVSINNIISKLKNSWGKEFTEDFSKVEFKRIMLNPEQIDEYALPENPTKKETHKDRVLAKRFIAKYGDRNVELESLIEHKPVGFEKVVTTALESHLNTEAMSKLSKREEIVKKRLRQILDNIKDNYLEEWRTINKYDVD